MTWILVNHIRDAHNRASPILHQLVHMETLAFQGYKNKPQKSTFGQLKQAITCLVNVQIVSLFDLFVTFSVHLLTKMNIFLGPNSQNRPQKMLQLTRTSFKDQNCKRKLLGTKFEKST